MINPSVNVGMLSSSSISFQTFRPNPYLSIYLFIDPAIIPKMLTFAADLDRP